MKKLKDPLLIAGIGFLVLLVFFAIFGPVFFGDPNLTIGDPHLPMGSKNALLGTDQIGRSILSRVIFGARISLIVGISVQLINLVVGITVGMLGEFAPKWISQPLMRLTDGMFAFPDILLAILIVGTVNPKNFTFIAPGLIPVIIALSISGWPQIARLVKTQVATLKDREFVVAAKAAGAPTTYLVFKHLLPQLTGILLAVSMIDLAGTILAESTLSFLGIGVQSPTPSWGSMINTARTNMTSYPIDLLWPCLTLSLTIFALNFVGDGLRNITDPKSR